jgi:hypothetical protein
MVGSLCGKLLGQSLEQDAVGGSLGSFRRKLGTPCGSLIS